MKVSLAPKVLLLETYRFDNWKLVDALEELVDNSLGEGRGNASRVDVTIDPRSREVTVFDNGAGMEDIGKIFVLGDGIGFRKNDSGRFGSGGTRALLSYADSPEVWTLRDGEMWHGWVDWDRLIKQGGDLGDKTIDTKLIQKRYWPEQFAKVKSGTLVKLDVPRWRSLRRQRADQRCPERLAQIFGPALEAGRKITVNGESLIAWKPDDFSPYVNERVELDSGLGGHLIAGVAKHLDASNARMHINYAYRWVESTDKPWSDRYHGAELYATLLLDGDWHEYLSPHKDAIIDDELRGQLIEKCADAMADLIDAVDDIDTEKLELKLTLNWPALRRAGKEEGGPPKQHRQPSDGETPDGEGNPREKSEPKEQDMRRRHGGKGSASDVRVSLQPENVLPGRSIMLKWDGEQGSPLVFYVNSDSRLGQQWKRNRKNPRVNDIVKEGLAAEAARVFQTRGHAHLALREAELSSLESMHDGNAAVVIQGVIERRLYEQFNPE